MSLCAWGKGKNQKLWGSAAVERFAASFSDATKIYELAVKFCPHMWSRQLEDNSWLASYRKLRFHLPDQFTTQFVTPKKQGNSDSVSQLGTEFCK